MNSYKKGNVSVSDILSVNKRNHYCNTILHNHEGLIVTIFGYGLNNAWLFEKRAKGAEVQRTFLLQP